jgi:hypothetical protein
MVAKTLVFITTRRVNLAAGKQQFVNVLATLSAATAFGHNAGR